MEMKVSSFQSLGSKAELIRSKASRFAIFGCAIAATTIVAATALSAILQFGYISIHTLIEAQRTNIVLWFLDATPFFYAIWGQYIGSIMSDEAHALMADQFFELRTHNEALENRAMHEATHDSLTGLPNRVLFHDRLIHMIDMSRRERNKFAIMLLDLNRFKEVNDTLGHANGDRVLKLVAQRLEDGLRKSDTLARFGGDEFAILLPGIDDETVLNTTAAKIHRSLQTPFNLNDLALEVQASMGMVIYPDHGEDAGTLIQRADIAMYVAKQSHRDSVIFETKLDLHNPQRLTLMGELRIAIENNDLTLAYQPKISAAKQHAIGAEVLVRWNHHKHGVIPPDHFIGLAEQTGLINPLTRWVLQHSLRQGTIWHNLGLKISLAVNLSARTLLDPDFPEILQVIIDESSFPADYLVLEVTETAVMTDPDLALDVINAITKTGVRISIDDFGTGYSSLAYLKQLPVSELKIDKSFVTDMLTNESDSAIVHATIDLAHNLGLEVVAEGVEDEATSDKLASLNCDTYQGYYFSKPVSSDELQLWFKHSSWGQS